MAYGTHLLDAPVWPGVRSATRSGGRAIRSGESVSKPPTAQQADVIIIDDDLLMRQSLDSLFRSIGLTTLTYPNGQEMLDAPEPLAPCCIVLDVRMPQMGGFEFSMKLAERGWRIPVVFMTGHGDIPMSVRAMKSGAVDFLPKPFREQDMIDAVHAALDHAKAYLAEQAHGAELLTRWEQLTPRERQVFDGVARGLLNKQIAGELGLSEITVKLHRASMLKKMGVRTVADLVRISEALATVRARD
jgi:FixJ family two-component response regulator